MVLQESVPPVSLFVQWAKAWTTTACSASGSLDLRAADWNQELQLGHELGNPPVRCWSNWSLSSVAVDDDLRDLVSQSLHSRMQGFLNCFWCVTLKGAKPTRKQVDAASDRQALSETTGRAGMQAQ